jgi:hypothetical protein
LSLISLYLKEFRILSIIVKRSLFLLIALVAPLAIIYTNININTCAFIFIAFIIAVITFYKTYIKTIITTTMSLLAFIIYYLNLLKKLLNTYTYLLSIITLVYKLIFYYL